MKAWTRLAPFLLASAAAANIAGAGWYFLLKEKVRETMAVPAVGIGSKFPVFAGVDLDGAKWTPQDAPCRVIRVTDDSCSYCKQDQRFYESILSAAAEASCEVIEMAPMAGRMGFDPRPGVVQLKYVNRDIASVIYPFVTPQTIVTDRDWVMRMYRRGAFDNKTHTSTISLLRSLDVSSATQ